MYCEKKFKMYSAFELVGHDYGCWGRLPIVMDKTVSAADIRTLYMTSTINYCKIYHF